MAICWKRAVPLAFHLCCFNFSAALVVRVPFPFGVQVGRIYRFLIIVSLISSAEGAEDGVAKFISFLRARD